MEKAPAQYRSRRLRICGDEAGFLRSKREIGSSTLERIALPGYSELGTGMVTVGFLLVG